MDSLEEEQLRGITMKSSAISLYYTNGGFSVVMAFKYIGIHPLQIFILFVLNFGK